MKLTHTLILLACSVLASCASMKPPMPEHMYNEAAVQWITVQQCGVEGLLSPETTALGKSYLQRSADVYQFDQNRLNAEVQRNGHRYLGFTSEACNRIAMKIMEVKQKDQPATYVTPYRPVTTNCSTYFGQTHCTTF